MKAFKEFMNYPSEFWAFVRFVSETLKYSNHSEGIVKEYNYDEISKICKHYNVNASDKLIHNTIDKSFYIIFDGTNNNKSFLSMHEYMMRKYKI